MIWNEILNLILSFLQMTPYFIVKDPVILANDLNHDLDNINQRAHQRKMVFNLVPTKQFNPVPTKQFNPVSTKQAIEILFSCKKMKPNHQC